ncbi:MAG: lysophospholipid acyltransferase family protein [Cytophagales bacterium]|nr:lysophospholipid acyltransferase family protein [Cytophagales bacterium]
MRLLNIIFFYGLIMPISYLPYPVLYAFSNGLYFLVYRVIGYRKKVVIQNIANSFPEKSHQEYMQIVRAFYRHFCDLVVESVKVFTISEKEVKERMKMLNPEFSNRFYDKGQSVIIAGGHYNNWELFAVAIDSEIKHQTVALYKTLKNEFFDEKMRSTRSKYGLQMTSTKMAKEEFEKTDGLKAIIFGFDQSPSRSNNCYWGTFLNQDTPMIFGVEKYAKEYDFPVLFLRINKVKRGYYTYEYVEAIEEPRKTGYGEITKRVNQLLEQDIIAEPQYYLWSHKRWKHKRPAESGQQ